MVKIQLLLRPHFDLCFGDGAAIARHIRTHLLVSHYSVRSIALHESRSDRMPHAFGAFCNLCVTLGRFASGLDKFGALVFGRFAPGFEKFPQSVTIGRFAPAHVPPAFRAACGGPSISLYRSASSIYRRHKQAARSLGYSPAELQQRDRAVCCALPL